MVNVVFGLNELQSTNGSPYNSLRNIKAKHFRETVLHLYCSKRV